MIAMRLGWWLVEVSSFPGMLDPPPYALADQYRGGRDCLRYLHGI